MLGLNPDIKLAEFAMHFTHQFTAAPHAHVEPADRSAGPGQAWPGARSTPKSAWPLHLQLGLEDLLGDLRHARRSGDLGRLALLSYCEVRRWARMAGDASLAEHSSELITHGPHSSREQFLAHVDKLIDELERLRPARVPTQNGPDQG